MEIEKENFSPSDAPYSFEHSNKMGKQILKPIRQEKIVKVPVTQYVEKIIEKEQIKYVNKYVDVIKPIITYKTKHIPKPIYLDKIKYEPKVIEKEKIVHVPKIEYRNKIVEIPVYVHKEKIIEKKVPLVIERVIPVLKVKKVEKEVFTNTVSIPEISEVSKNEAKKNESVNDNQPKNEISINISAKENDYSTDLKNNTDAYNKETFRNYESSEKKFAVSTNQLPHNEMDKFKDNNSNDDNTNSDEKLYKMNLEHNNETGYHDMACDESNYDEISENRNIIINEETNSESVKREIEESSYEINENNRNFNTTHVSIHLPTTTTEVQKSVSQNYLNVYDNNYNISLNNIADNNSIIDNRNISNKYNRDNLNTMINEQFIQESCNDSKRFHSASIHENIPGSYSAITKNHIEAEGSFVNPPHMHTSYENYISTQNIHEQRSIPSKSNFKPYYANSNGQAFVSVRPATIVEYKPKPRKNKTTLCNFMNQCCGGNQS